MFTKTLSRIETALAVMVGCAIIMGSCSEPTHARGLGQSSAPYTAPYMPLGDCAVDYSLSPGEVSQLDCTFDVPAGLDPQHVSVMASVGSGDVRVQSWLIGASDFNIEPFAEIYVVFGVKNVGTTTISSRATVHAVVAPAVAPAGAN